MHTTKLLIKTDLANEIADCQVSRDDLRELLEFIVNGTFDDLTGPTATDRLIAMLNAVDRFMEKKEQL